MISGLDSASLKIVRATKHLKEINGLIAKVAAGTGAYKIIEDANGKETVNFLVEPPSDVAILAGEIVYQLRSAIDHLAFDLVKYNPAGIVLPANWEERCCFPLWLKVPKKSPTYNCFDYILPGISKGAFAFIESVQPYHSGQGPQNALRIIAQLSNVDKHRHLNAILPKVAVRQDFEFASGSRAASVVGGFQHGAEIPSATITRGKDAMVDMKRSFLPYVTFEETTIGSGPATLESQNVLEVCLEQVERVIIPAFIQLLKKP